MTARGKPATDGQSAIGAALIHHNFVAAYGVIGVGADKNETRLRITGSRDFIHGISQIRISGLLIRIGKRLLLITDASGRSTVRAVLLVSWAKAGTTIVIASTHASKILMLRTITFSCFHV